MEDVHSIAIDGRTSMLLLVAIAAFLLLAANAHNLPKIFRGRAEVLALELHPYQLDFLDMLSEYEGHPGYALQALIERAAREPKVKAACFDRLHCLHCGSLL